MHLPIFPSAVLSAREIQDLCKKDPPLISPFHRREGFPSFGVSVCGYDLSLAPEFVIFTQGILDVLRELPHERLYCPDRFELPPHSVVLGRSTEYLRLPKNIVGLVLGKSTYARCGLLVNATPLEPGWEGNVVLELANLSSNPIVLYPGKGIAQVLFLRTSRTPGYSGVYQHQRGVVLPGGKRSVGKLLRT